MKGRIRLHYNCLIVDDERVLAESTCEYFNLFEVNTKAVFTATECREFLEENTVDLILLDINLENESGFLLCKEIRLKTDVPILFISARQSDDDVIIALNIGGDDYIKKPYSLGVLLAKVRVVLKRCAAYDKGATILSDSSIGDDEGSKAYDNNADIFECNRLRVNFVTGKVYVLDSEISLKAMEYKLLCYLIRNNGRIISKDELFESVWQDAVTGDGTLNVHIRHLREKIEEKPDEPIYIKTVWGRGYVFEA